MFKREITYSTDKNIAANLVTIDADRAFEVIALNKAGEKPMSLLRDGEKAEADKKQYNDILGQDITRFDKKKKKKKKNKNRPRNPENPSNDSPNTGRNANHDQQPAMSASRRMMNGNQEKKTQ